MVAPLMPSTAWDTIQNVTVMGGPVCDAIAVRNATNAGKIDVNNNVVQALTYENTGILVTNVDLVEVNSGITLSRNTVQAGSGNEAENVDVSAISIGPALAPVVVERNILDGNTLTTGGVGTAINVVASPRPIPRATSRAAVLP